MIVEKTLNIEDLKRFRHQLHGCPEPSGKEFSTSETVKNFLKPLGPDQWIEPIDQNGFAVIYKGRYSGPRVMVRACLDGFPLLEQDNFPYYSRNRGWSHKSGQDGHIAMLCGMAELYQRQRPKRGEVVLLFQSSEQDGEGAYRVLQSPFFKYIVPEYVIGFQNLPGYDLGAVLLKENEFLASAQGLKIELEGASTFAGRPEEGISPAGAMVNIVQKLQNNSYSNGNFSGFVKPSVTYAHLGTPGYGLLPDKAEIMVNLIAEKNLDLAALISSTESMIKENAAENGLNYHLHFKNGFPNIINKTDTLGTIFEDALNGGKYPVQWIDQTLAILSDFGHFSDRFKTIFFGIGAGKEVKDLYHPAYDFPDALIEPGADLLHTLVNHCLENL